MCASDLHSVQRVGDEALSGMQMEEASTGYAAGSAYRTKAGLHRVHAPVAPAGARLLERIATALSHAAPKRP